MEGRVLLNARDRFCYIKFYANLGVSCEAADNVKGVSNVYTIPCFNKYLPQSYYVDVFNSGVGKLKWKALPSDSWILVDRKSGV